MAVVLAALVAVVRGVPCAQRDSCSSCNAPPDDGSRACFWCFDAGQQGCQEVQLLASGAPVGSCKTITFAQGDCQCQPAQRRTCGECTPDWNCVWSNATLSFEGESSAGFSTGVVTVGTGAACRVGNGFQGPFTLASSTRWQILGLTYTVSWVLQPSVWYWSQCGLAGPAPAWLYLTGGILAVACCCSCFCFLSRRRRRRRQELASPFLVRVP